MEERHGSENHKGFVKSSVRIQARGKRHKIPTNVAVGTCSRQNKKSNTENNDPLPFGSERERFFNAKGFNSPDSSEVHSAVQGKGLITLAAATSGVAAGLLPGGRTAYSRFRIPLEVSAESACSISKQSSSAKLFRIT